MDPLTGTTTLVVGASRGLGRGIATALADAGADVVAVSRTPPTSTSEPVRYELADAVDATAAARLLDRYEPDVVVLVAGAIPHMRPLQQQTWESFSVNWESDVRLTFHWLREALLKPLSPGAKVIVFSSGAAANASGSPLSGGYAGAKATQRFITGYARDEANRAGLELTFTTVLPRFAPATGVGVSAIRAYAARSDLAIDDYLERQPYALLTPEIAGRAIVELAHADAAEVAPEYMLSGAGLEKLP